MSSKPHHNFKFSPQMLHDKINEDLCLQNPPQSSFLTTNATELNQCESMSSKRTTIFSFHHKCYRTKSVGVYVFKTHHNLQFSPQMLHNRSMRVYVFKTHHNLQFSTQMLQNKINESLCLKPTTIFSFHHKCYRTKSMRIYVLKTHHNLQFSPQMLQNKINKSLCLQSSPHSSVFTTNATEPDR